MIAGTGTFAQDTTEEKILKKEVTMQVEDEGEGPTYKVKVVTDKDGKKEVIERTYSSLAEMEADTTISIKGKEADGQGTYSFNFSDEAEKQGKTMVLSGDDGKTVKVKVVQAGEGMSWTVKEEDGHQVIQSKGGNMVMIMDDGEEGHAMSWVSEDGDSTRIVKKYEIRVESDEDDMEEDMERVFIIKSDDQFDILDKNDEKTMVWINEDGNKSIKKSIRVETKRKSFSTATISDLDFSDEKWAGFKLGSMPALSLKTLNYFPNPSEGEFTLAFSAGRKPVTVRILDSNGNLQYEAKKDDFSGNFNEMINLKSLDGGSYILQIFQQGKVLSRQIELK